MTFEFPNGFPRQSRAKVELACQQAQAAYAERMRNASTAKLTVNAWGIPVAKAAWREIVQLVIAPLVVFIQEACQSVDLFPSDINDWIDRNFHLLACDAAYEQSHDSIHIAYDGFDAFKRELWNRIKNSDEWKGHRTMLLTCAALREPRTEKSDATDQPRTSSDGGPMDHGKEHSLPTVQQIEGALIAGDRERAVILWQEMRRSMDKESTKAALFKAAKQHKSEYYKWEKCKLPDGSAADKALRRVLTTGD